MCVIIWDICASEGGTQTSGQKILNDGKHSPNFMLLVHCLINIVFSLQFLQLHNHLEIHENDTHQHLSNPKVTVLHKSPSFSFLLVLPYRTSYLQRPTLVDRHLLCLLYCLWVLSTTITGSSSYSTSRRYAINSSTTKMLFLLLFFSKCKQFHLGSSER